MRTREQMEARLAEIMDIVKPYEQTSTPDPEFIERAKTYHDEMIELKRALAKMDGRDFIL